MLYSLKILNTETIVIISEQKKCEKDSGLDTGVKRHHASGLFLII